jgi:predicted dehydrogenase
VTPDPEAVLRAPEIALVSIASYDDAHFGQVLAALEAGKHVFVEKPICRTDDELQGLRGAWLDANGPRLASNLVLRSAPLFRWLVEQRQLGHLGQTYAFDGDYLYGRVEKITEGWRKDVPDYSVMLGGGIHLVDLMLLVSGERPTTVTAVGNRIATAESGFRYHDFAAAAFEFPSGLVGRISANFGCVHRHQHVVRVFGTEATFVSDDSGARWHASRDPGVPPRAIELAPEPGSKGELIPEFVDAILSGADTRARTEHEFDVVRACLAADHALSEGGRVDIDYVW